ncbi:MAG TPA: hypothetical protein PK537_04490 [Candidatus Limiplasma sp.]|nr:hypothetical protein [Candidatus Limiplasma sp.]
MMFDLLFQPAPPGASRCTGGLTDDLRLDVLLDAMAAGDARTAQACRQVLLAPLTDAQAIAARREVRGDITAHPQLFSTLLTSAREAMDAADRYAEFQKPRYDHIISPQKKLLTEITIAKQSLKILRRMHAAVTAEHAAFGSGAVTALADTIIRLFSAENVKRMEARLAMLDSLKLSDDLTLSASVGDGLKPAHVVLNTLARPMAGRRRLTEAGIPIALSSVGLIRNAEEIVQSAVTPLLQTVAEFSKSLRDFFNTLSFQLGFYLGCIRLQNRLRAIGVPLCEPDIDDACGGMESDALCSAGLALQEGRIPMGNAVRFREKRLVVITGVNQGGKTTFLRGVGQAQLMAQCGMFVAAQTYRCPLYRGIYTHFPSGEDTARDAGLLDVELRKLSSIVDCIRPHSLLLLNETFQTTMPADARYMAEITVRALTDSGVAVVFVTHLYAYAAAAYARHQPDTLFLRAERAGTVQKAYVLREGKPYSSAAGDDLYREVLGGY